MLQRLFGVPEFKAYYSTPEMMDFRQKAFFNFLIKEIRHGRYPSVQGNISYLFAYTYPFMEQWRQKGFKYVYDKLIEMVEAYHYEEQFAGYCRGWANDCLLSLRLYDEYLEQTEPEDILPSYASFSNERCNILYHIGRPAKTKDFLALFAWRGAARLTKYSIENLEIFAEIVDSIFEGETTKNGPWLNRLLAGQRNPKTKPHSMFNAVPIDKRPELDFGFYNFQKRFSVYVNFIAKRMRVAENRVRKLHNLPKIGEGWVSETAMYHAIKKAFPQTQVVQHGRPAWLGKQHLDIWLPRWKIAVEYHGRQHFEPVEFFGGTDAFKATRERDARKKELCLQNNITLIIATANNAHAEIVERVAQVRQQTMMHK